MEWNGMVREWIFLRPCGFNKDEWCQMVMKGNECNEWMNEWMQEVWYTESSVLGLVLV
jgi:hypothetical protein